MISLSDPFHFLIPDEKISEIKLIAVEEDPGDITQDEDTDNTDQDEGKIYLSPDRALGPQMRKPEKHYKKTMCFAEVSHT